MSDLEGERRTYWRMMEEASRTCQYPQNLIIKIVVIKYNVLLMLTSAASKSVIFLPPSLPIVHFRVRIVTYIQVLSCAATTIATQWVEFLLLQLHCYLVTFIFARARRERERRGGGEGGTLPEGVRGGRDRSLNLA